MDINNELTINYLITIGQRTIMEKSCIVRTTNRSLTSSQVSEGNDFCVQYNFRQYMYVGEGEGEAVWGGFYKEQGESWREGLGKEKELRIYKGPVGAQCDWKIKERMGSKRRT